MSRQALLLLGWLACASVDTGTATGQPLDDVQPVDWSGLSPQSFSDAEVDRQQNYGPAHTFIYYVEHLHAIANAVRNEEPNRGFIDIAVWRNPSQHQQPYNARIMENILSLAWFYTHDADWNPYYGDPALRGRLEVALDYWVKIAHPTTDRFAETSATNYKLAPTAFATRFIGQALNHLDDGPAFDAGIYEAADATLRKAIMSELNSNPEFNSGIKFTNQYGNLWGGALSYLDRHGDDNAMRDKLQQRVIQSQNSFQSPAGYMYEEGGPDWSYNLNTHMSNMDTAWNYLHDRETPFEEALADAFTEEHEKFIEWVAYNAVPQPDGSFFVLNAAMATRQQQGVLARFDSPLAEVVPLARAFSLTRDEVATRIADERTAIAQQWGDISDLEVGSFSGYSPYAFMHREHYKWYPTEAERQAAFAQLPYLASARFNHQRVDDDHPQVYTYVRRPSYYAAFNTGNNLKDQQRMGLGLLWHPQAGALLQSQVGSTSHAWGTKTANRALYEASDITASFTVDGVDVAINPGARDLDDGVLQIHYPLGVNGQKTIRFLDDHLAVSVLHAGDFVEQLPLLVLEDDVLVVDLSGVTLTRDGALLLSITFGEQSNISGVVRNDSGIAVDAMQVVSIHIHANDRLDYQISLVPEPATALSVTAAALLRRQSRPRAGAAR